jgi:hypothetical protein
VSASPTGEPPRPTESASRTGGSPEAPCQVRLQGRRRILTVRPRRDRMSAAVLWGVGHRLGRRFQLLGTHVGANRRIGLDGERGRPSSGPCLVDRCLLGSARACHESARVQVSPPPPGGHEAGSGQWDAGGGRSTPVSARSPTPMASSSSTDPQTGRVQPAGTGQSADRSDTATLRTRNTIVCAPTLVPSTAGRTSGLRKADDAGIALRLHVRVERSTRTHRPVDEQRQ